MMNHIYQEKWGEEGCWQGVCYKERKGEYILTLDVFKGGGKEERLWVKGRNPGVLRALWEKERREAVKSKKHAGSGNRGG